MFTIRVEATLNSYIVYRTTQYKVRRAGNAKMISIKEDELDGEQFKDLEPLENGGTAYVMNEQGVTVDVIRTR